MQGPGANRRRRGSAGGEPTGFDKTICKRRNEAERTINALTSSRAVATRFDKRAYVFYGTVTTVAVSRAHGARDTGFSWLGVRLAQFLPVTEASVTVHSGPAVGRSHRRRTCSASR